MKNKSIPFTAILLMITIGNYFRMIHNESIRAVEFFSIFAMGALAGVLLVQVMKTIKERK